MMMELTNYNVFAADLRKRGIVYAAEHTAALGFHSVEWIDLWNARKPLPDTLDVDEACRVFDKYGLKAACYSMAVPLHRQPEENLGITLRHASLAAKLGSPFFHHTVTLYQVVREEEIPFSDMLARVLPSLTVIARRCEELGMTVLYEPQGAYFNGKEPLSLLLRTMRAEGCDNVGFCADVGNSYEVDEPAFEIFDCLSSDIRHVHLKDYQIFDTLPEDHPYDYTTRAGKYMYECEIGQGNVDIGRCFDVLRRIDYRGAFSFETYGDDASIKRAISYVRSLWQ